MTKLLLALIAAMPASGSSPASLPPLPGATGVAPAAEAGQVVAASTELLLLRGSETYAASTGALVLNGDRVVAGGSGTARLLLDDGKIVALAPGTMAMIQGTPAARFITLESGETRITAGGAGSVTVEFGSARAEIRSGILRAAVEGACLKVERGAATITSATRAPFRLEEGREASVSANARPILVSNGSQAWTIAANEIAVATPADDARALLAMQAPKPSTSTVKPATADTAPKPATPGNSVKPATPGEPVKPTPPLPRQPNPNLPDIPTAPEETETTRGGPLAPPEETTRAAGIQPGAADDPNNPTNRPYQPVAVAQPASTASISLTLGNISASSSAASSGAFNSDAQQDSINLSFPGNIHLVTGQTSYTLYNVHLLAKDMFPTDNQLWSVGLGPLPKGQVVTNLGSGTDLNPAVIRVPHTREYLIRLDQVRYKDAVSNSSTNSSFNAIGLTGFTGAQPSSPQINGATPLTDPSAILNNRLTFALGEFGLATAGHHPVLNVRSSDQDRKIVLSPDGNPQGDVITPNPNVNFTNAKDFKFFPNLQSVKVPVDNTAKTPTVIHPPTYRHLTLLQKAAATTLLAQALYPYTQRTGQYRFVINGQIVDVSGYRPTKIPPTQPVQTAIAHAQPKSQAAITQAMLRSGHAAPGMAGGPVKAAHQHAARQHRAAR